MKKTEIEMNKPIYLGFSILELSKILMYDFHYNYMKEKYGDKAHLLFTDTDSLAYEIDGDVERLFDTSNYPKSHPSGIKTGVNKKVLGMFKDEFGGAIMAEFAGLRSKLYSYKMLEGKETKKCKGVKKAVVKKSIAHDDFVNCVFSGKPQMRPMDILLSYGHQMFTCEINKVALSANDDKRFIQECGVKTLAYGHQDLRSKPEIIF